VAYRDFLVASQTFPDDQLPGGAGKARPGNKETCDDGKVPHDNKEIATKEATANNELAGSGTPMDTTGNDDAPVVTTTSTENERVHRDDGTSMELDSFFSEAAAVTTSKPRSPHD